MQINFQFYDKFYRPDIVKLALQDKKINTGLKLADVKPALEAAIYYGINYELCGSYFQECSIIRHIRIGKQYVKSFIFREDCFWREKEVFKVVYRFFLGVKEYFFFGVYDCCFRREDEKFFAFNIQSAYSCIHNSTDKKGGKYIGKFYENQVPTIERKNFLKW